MTEGQNRSLLGSCRKGYSVSKMWHFSKLLHLRKQKNLNTLHVSFHCQYTIASVHIVLSVQRGQKCTTATPLLSLMCCRSILVCVHILHCRPKPLKQRGTGEAGRRHLTFLLTIHLEQFIQPTKRSRQLRCFCPGERRFFMDKTRCPISRCSVGIRMFCCSSGSRNSA